MQNFLSDVAPYGKVKIFRSDGGGEYTSKEFRDLMHESQIKHEFSAPTSLHQNGTAERAWKTLFEMARCMLFKYNLPKTLWTYAVRYAAYVRNRCYSRQLEKTPFEKFCSKIPNVSKLYEFGIKCFSYNYDTAKLDTRAIEGVFVGQDPCSPAYLVYDKVKNKIRKARCVKFVTNPEDIISDSNGSPPEEEDSLVEPAIPLYDPPVRPSCVSEGEPDVLETQDPTVDHQVVNEGLGTGIQI